MDLTARPPDDEMTRLVVEALASSETEEAPAPLRARVLAAAQAERPAGRPPGVRLPSPLEAYRQTVDDLDEVLSRRLPAEWEAVVEPYGWTVQGMVGHILAIERLLGTRLGVDRLDVPPEVEVDHIGMTQAIVAAQEGRDPTETLVEWRRAARRVLDVLAAGDANLDDQVSVHGLTLRWRDLLVVRSLELWTHSDDIRRAIGRPIVAPDAGRMALMTNLAVRSLPYRLAATGGHAGSGSGGVARIVLTGVGGGVWVQPFGQGDAAAEPDVRIVADAVGFCRLTAGRLTTDELAARIDGDHRLAADILSATAAFAV
ncbi:MAG: maleylpyruvate isomerase family mycothiol-dependent enzyme [Acidimicrobiales bacterium]